MTDSPKARIREHTNLILVCLLAFAAIALFVTVLANRPSGETYSRTHLAQNGPGNFVSDPEIYYERCGPPASDEKDTLVDGDLQRILVYSREGISLHFVLHSGQGWQAMSPYATVYPSGDIMAAEAWRQKMGCLFEEDDIPPDN